jgi:hypothetical protein
MQNSWFPRTQGNIAVQTVPDMINTIAMLICPGNEETACLLVETTWRKEPALSTRAGSDENGR